MSLQRTQTDGGWLTAVERDEVEQRRDFIGSAGQVGGHGHRTSAIDLLDVLDQRTEVRHRPGFVRGRLVRDCPWQQPLSSEGNQHQTPADHGGVHAITEGRFLSRLIRPVSADL